MSLCLVSSQSAPQLDSMGEITRLYYVHSLIVLLSLLVIVFLKMLFLYYFLLFFLCFRLFGFLVFQHYK